MCAGLSFGYCGTDVSAVISRSRSLILDAVGPVAICLGQITALLAAIENASSTLLAIALSSQTPHTLQ